MGRKRGSRFRSAIDAQKQLEGIEKIQQAWRQGKSRRIVERIDKSQKRFDNFVKRIKHPKDARDECE